MTRLLRLYLPVALALFALGLLGGFAWLTHHPDHPRLEEAEDWPWVGSLARAFRARYLGPVPAWEPREPAPVTAREAASPLPGVLDPRPTRWVARGTELRGEPSESAAVVTVVGGFANLPVLEQSGGWVRLAWEGREGWAVLPETVGGDGPPLGSQAEPVLPRAEEPPSAERLERALATLGSEARELGVGPYTLYTDSGDRQLLDLLDRVAQHLEGVYRQRYGVLPVGSPHAVVVLFSQESAYRSLGRAELPPHVPHTGHVSQGLVALYQGQRLHEEVGATLVHELVHLLNRRALGPGLPPWLDEGLADDLAASRMGADGKVHPGTLSQAVVPRAGGFEVHGGLATLHRLFEGEGAHILPLEELASLSHRELLGSPARAMHYSQAAFFVRFLLEGELGTLFRAFLAGVARGEPATGEALLGHLGRSWAQLDTAFHGWVHDLAARTRLDLSNPS